jgi:putative acetyltransferase
MDDRMERTSHVFSLVAEIRSVIVGHIMFSRMWIRTPRDLLSAVALAPVAVVPEHQRKGLGSRRIQHGLEHLRNDKERS